jgi:hypothetical protein
MPNRETSDAISSMAGKYLHFGQADLESLDEAGKVQLVTAIRALAASALSQDEHHGKREPAAGSTAYEMVAASETAHVETTETLIHMTAATVLHKLIEEEGGGRLNITFSPDDMDNMHRLYQMDATHDGMITTVRIEPREGAFPGASLRVQPGIDDTPADEQAPEHVYDRPLWATRIDGKLFPASDREQAEKMLQGITDDQVAQVENRFCYHNDCPAERCNHVGVNAADPVPDQDGAAEVTSES